MPKGITVEPGPGLLLVHRKPLGDHFFWIVFCVFWNGGLGLPLVVERASGNPKPIEPWMLILVAAGGVFLYPALEELLNRTRIAVQGGRLVVRHGPIPWPGNVDVPASGVRQLYCVEKVNYRKPGGRYFTYEVAFHGFDGSQGTLVKGFADPEQALFVEQALERHLRIEDRPVYDEMPR